MEVKCSHNDQSGNWVVRDRADPQQESGRNSESVGTNMVSEIPLASARNMRQGHRIHGRSIGPGYYGLWHSSK